MSLKITKLSRQLDVRGAGGKVDKEKRTITFPFSSTYPVDRWFGKEILSHDEGAVDLSRLNAGAPFLFNHNSNDYRGVVEKAWIGEDKRGMCEVRFGSSPEATQLMTDIDEGILRNVSVGYEVNELVLSKRGENGENSEYTVTRWAPYEVSAAPCPADPTVGMGRGPEVELMVRSATENFEKKNKPVGVIVPTQERDKAMDEVEKKKLEMAAAENAVKAERERAAVISAMCKKYELGDLARELIDGGKTVDEARAAVLEKIGMKQVPVTGTEGEIGLTEREIGSFSFLKIMRALSDPQNRRAQEEAAFEREVSLAAQKTSGRAAQGFLIPFDVLRAPLMNPKMAKRDLSVAVSTAGGDFVATNLLASSFIELLRNKAALFSMGVQSMTGLVGDIAIPRQTGAATAYWVGEAVDETESDQAIDQVTMSPNTVGAMTQYSRKLILQSSLDVEAFVRNDIAEIIALELDRVGLYGLGSSNQPLGLKGTSGINTTDLAGATPTWSEIVGMESKINAANANIGAMSYLMGATQRGNLKTAVKVSSYPVFIMDDNGMVNGYKSVMSNQVASGDYWFGVWNQLIYGFWSGLDVLLDPYSNSKSGTIRIVAHQDVDLAVRHPAAFSRANDTL